MTWTDLKKINMGQYSPTENTYPMTLDQNNKLERGDIREKTRGGVTVLVWKDSRKVYKPSKVDPPPTE
jgi:hypothetical protein